jgi:kynurenine formamidase
LPIPGSGWLVEKEIKTFGVNSPSPDNPINPTYPCHIMCSEHGITHYENLAKLDQLVGKRFTFIGFPLRIRGGKGSPRSGPSQCSRNRKDEIGVG